MAPSCPPLAVATPCQSLPVMPNPTLQRVDGIGDEFCTVPELSFVVKDMPQIYPAPALDSPVHGALRVAWSADYFHAYAHVSDPSVLASASADLWDGDAVELFIAPPSSAGYDGHYSAPFSSSSLHRAEASRHGPPYSWTTL